MSLSGSFVKLIVDPRTAATLATTVILAATSTGLWCLADGGATWSNVLAGSISSLIAYMPTSGDDQYYAGVVQSGLFQATDPTGSWTNLIAKGVGLPAFASGNFTEVLVDYCPLSPSRVYVWLTNPNQTVGIYTTSSPLTSWTQVSASSPPSPSYGLYSDLFAVAPNSPGDGANDILFFGEFGCTVPSTRGRHGKARQPHSTPINIRSRSSRRIPPSGTIPAMYIGSDGGIAMSDQFCDPSY